MEFGKQWEEGGKNCIQIHFSWKYSFILEFRSGKFRGSILIKNMSILCQIKNMCQKTAFASSSPHTVNICIGNFRMTNENNWK